MELIYWALYSTVQLYVSLLFYLHTQPISGSHRVYAQSSVTYLLLRSQYDIGDAMPFKVPVALTSKATTLYNKDTSLVKDESITNS